MNCETSSSLPFFLYNYHLKKKQIYLSPFIRNNSFEIKLKNIFYEDKERVLYNKMNSYNITLFCNFLENYNTYKVENFSVN